MAASGGVELKKVMQKPLVASEDMSSEMSIEVLEIVTSAVDKFLSTENYEKAAQAIKEAMDRKFGPSWHAIVGEGFGFNVTFNKHQMQYVYYGEKLGIVVFKC